MKSSSEQFAWQTSLESALIEFGIELLAVDRALVNVWQRMPTDDKPHRRNGAVLVKPDWVKKPTFGRLRKGHNDWCDAYPPVLGSDPVPLAIGIPKQILNGHPEIERQLLRKLLHARCHCWHRYLKATKEADAIRRNLDGTAAGVVNAAEATFAKVRLASINPRSTAKPILNMKGIRSAEEGFFRAVNGDSDEPSPKPMGPVL